MNKSILLARLTAVVLAAGLLGGVKPAKADSLNITYFTIAENDKDANHLGFGLVTNEVQNHLGANGLPILNTPAFGCVSNCFALVAPTDVLGDGEITYWSPTLNNGGAGGTSDVTQTGTGVVTLPYTNDSFFPPNGSGQNGDNLGFQAAILSGNITAGSTESIGFNIGSDDMAFLYLDGTLQCSDGGVHANGTVPCNTSIISAGTHTIQLFFVDINNTQSALDFSITTQDVTTAPSVPEPSTFVFLGTGLLGAAGAIRRRFVR